MKKIQIIFVLILCVLLTGCSTGSSNGLTEKEQAVVNALLIRLPDFYNQTQARIVAVGDEKTESSFLSKMVTPEETESIDIPVTEIVVRIQATNKLGGTLSKYYRLTIFAPNLDEYKSKVKDDSISLMEMLWPHIGDMSEIKDEYFSISQSASDVDVGNINKAIENHWKSLGLL